MSLSIFIILLFHISFSKSKSMNDIFKAFFGQCFLNLSFLRGPMIAIYSRACATEPKDYEIKSWFEYCTQTVIYKLLQHGSFLFQWRNFTDSIFTIFCSTIFSLFTIFVTCYYAQDIY